MKQEGKEREEEREGEGREGEGRWEDTGNYVKLLYHCWTVPVSDFHFT